MKQKISKSPKTVQKNLISEEKIFPDEMRSKTFSCFLFLVVLTYIKSFIAYF